MTCRADQSLAPNAQPTSLVSRKGLVLILVICLALSLTAIGLRADSLRPENAVLGVLIGWCGFVPGFAYLAAPSDERPPFPFAALVGLFYSVFFGWSVFLITYLRDPSTGYINEYGSILIKDMSPETQLLALAGVALMLVVWALANRTVFANTPRFRISAPQNKQRILALAWLLALASNTYHWFPEIQSLPSVGQLLKPAGIVAFSIFSYFLSRRALPLSHAVLYFLVVCPLWIFELLSTGSSTVIVLIAGLFLVYIITAMNRIPWVAIAGVLLLVVFLYPFLNSYRHFIWSTDPTASYSQKIKYLGAAFLRLKGFDAEELNLRMVGVARRVSTQVLLNRVVQMTPESVPYLQGQTYKPIISSWIPRAVWPGKPIENAGEAFGHRYKWILPQLKDQSMNIPWIIELYANFGKTGTLVGMALIGLFLSLLDRFFNRIEMSPLEISVGAAIILPLTFPDSNFSLMTGSLLPLSLCLWLYFSVGLRLPWPGLSNRQNS